jgi:hypothetical protein
MRYKNWTSSGKRYDNRLGFTKRGHLIDGNARAAALVDFRNRGSQEMSDLDRTRLGPVGSAVKQRTKDRATVPIHTFGGRGSPVRKFA